MLQREIGKVELGARGARQRAQAMLKDSEGVHECVGCKNRVTLPCWFCVVCKDNVFICDDCDSPAGVSAGTHDKMHCVVKCTPPVAASRTSSVEERLTALERRFDHLEGTVGSLDSKFVQVDDRLSRIERLLESLASKAGGDS